MSAFCGVCSSVCGDDKNDIVCSVCEKCFHLKCVTADQEGVKTRSRKDWKCRDCRTCSASSSIKSNSETTVLTKDFLMTVMDEFKNHISNELKNFKREIEDLTASLQHLSDNVDKSNELMKEIKKENADIRKENAQLRSFSQKLAGTVDELQDRLRNLEQYTRRNNLEVSGIPVTPNESVKSIIKDVGVALGVSVKEEEINAVHRVPSFRRDGASSIVVQFHARASRDNLIDKFRKRKDLLASDVNPAFKKQKIYVSEHLSPENKLFLSKLKQQCRDVGYKFAWYREGKFYVRKSEGERCLKINSANEIDNLK